MTTEYDELAAEACMLCLQEFAKLTRHKAEVLRDSFRFEMRYDIGRDMHQVRIGFGKREHNFSFKGMEDLRESAPKAARSLYVSAG